MSDPLLPEEQQQEDDNLFFDVAAAPFRGIEGAIQGVYNLADYATFDALPDYDERFLGRSSTMAGSFVEGVSQFMTGFVPIFGLAGRVGSAAKAGSLAQRVISGRGIAAGALTDFTVFNGQEERLSNLIQQFPELQNPVTEFLAHDDEEGEIEGRLKNVLEGLGLEAIGAGAFVAGMKAIKKVRGVEDPVAKAQAVKDELGEDHIVDLEAFHGSLYKFKTEKDALLGKFKNENIGTGEGEQAYGYGHYFASKKDLAEHHKNKIQTEKTSQGWVYTVELNVKESDLIDWNKPLKAQPTSVKEKLKTFLVERSDEDTWEEIYQHMDYKELKDNALEELSEEQVSKVMKDIGILGLRYMDGEAGSTGKGDFNYVIFDGDDVTIKNRSDAALPDLQDGLKASDALDDSNAFDDIIASRPPLQPYKTNLQAGRGLEGSRGASKLKNRLQIEENKKNADPVEVEAVNKLIDMLGDRLEDVSLSIRTKLSARGRFDFGKRLIELRKDILDKGDLTRPMVHELWHAASRYLPEKDIKALTKQFEREREKYIKSFGLDIEDNFDVSTVQTKELPEELQKFLRGEKGDFNEANYRYKNIDEYFAEEMTDAFLSKLDGDFKLAPERTLKRYAQEFAILLKDVFDSLKSKLGIDETRRIFSDFVKQRNVKKRRSGPLDYGSTTKDMADFASEVSPEYRGIAKQIAEGAKISLPRFETTDQQHSFIEALREEVKNNPTSMAQMEKEAAEGLPVDFGDNDITDRMAKSIADQKQVRLEATVYKRIGTGMVKKLLDIAQEYKDAGGGDVATAKLKNAFQEMVSFSEMYWKLGRESSLALGIRRQGNRGRRKIGLNGNEMTGEGIRKNFVNENGGMSTEKIIKAVEEIDPEDLEKSINGMFKLARKTQGRKFLDMPSEYWINSILSGPRTHMVNIIGNGLTTAWTTAEMAIGGALSGNMEITKQTFASWADMTMLRESMKFARKTWGDSLNRPGENLLDPDARAFNEGQTNAITPEAFGMKEKDRGYEMVSGIGNFLRIPTRLLMTSDEFFKQLNYRRAARFKLAIDGINKHQIKDPKQLAEFVEKGLEDVITSGGRHYSEESLIREGMKTAENRGITDEAEREQFVNQFVKDNKLSNDVEASALADFALEESRYLTFTKDLDKGSLGEGIQRLQQNFSPLRFVLPFVRTPTNILAFAFERTPGVFMPGFLKEERKRLLEGYNSTDPIERARARGKVATSTALTAVILDTLVNQRENITGGGPKNEQEKKALMATGWQPYSIRMNGTYYSYQRLDPFGTILGVLADLVDVGIREPKNPTNSRAEELFSAVSITFARNVTNKSYLAGVQMATDALSDPDRYAQRLGRNLVSSFIPFSGFFSQTQSIQGDQEAREIRSMGDAILNKLPGGRTNLDPKRNILGESVIIENKPLVGAINPIAMTDQKNDVVLQEMADLNHAFRAPNSTYNGVIDLLEFTNSKGQTAHDRRLEKLQSVRLNGKTMRQALERLIKSRNYQRLPSQSEPGFPSPRIREINRVLNRYRSEALEDTLKEFPELSDYYDQIKSMKSQYGSTYDHSDVLSLLSN